MNELNDLKLAWETLSTRLEKAEILNTRMVKEMINARSKTSLNRLRAREIYLICVGAVIGILFFILKSKLGLEGMSLFLLAAASLITIGWAGVKLVMLNRLNVDKKSVRELMVEVNRYKIRVRWERPLATTVGIILLVILLYIFDINYTASFYVFYGIIIVLAYVATYVHYIRFDKKNMEEYEKTLKELEELE